MYLICRANFTSTSITVCPRTLGSLAAELSAERSGNEEGLNYLRGVREEQADSGGERIKPCIEHFTRKVLKSGGTAEAILNYLHYKVLQQLILTTSKWIIIIVF